MSQKEEVAVILGLSGNAWLEIGLAVGGVALALILIRLLTDILLRRLLGSIVGRTATDLDDVLVEVTSLPIQLTLMAIALD
ncbi:MAG: hypothetical protein GWN87_13325, partial [Desulfuromonadales bacterium]|nr:hypothetical protein [Desulfuromonadales bacterium]NIS41338.1 hypothetical protein [Desulfuromonadales bacterium]